MRAFSMRLLLSYALDWIVIVYVLPSLLYPHY